MATFGYTSVQIQQSKQTIIEGPCISTNGLWTLNLEPGMKTNQEDPLREPPGIQLQNLAYNDYKMTTQQDLVRYFHKCCFSPTASPWLAAIKAGFFATWC
jgi:hypothetical protein